jgi:hypothetical protein
MYAAFAGFYFLMWGRLDDLLAYYLLSCRICLYELNYVFGVLYIDLNKVTAVLNTILPMFVAGLIAVKAIQFKSHNEMSLSAMSGFASLGIMLWSLGQLIWSIYYIGGNIDVPYPSLADLGFFPNSLLWLIAILVFYHGKVHESPSRVLGGFGGLLTATWPIMLAVITLVRGTNERPDNLIKMALDIYYPFVDSINFFLMAVLITDKEFFRSINFRAKSSIIILSAFLFVSLITDVSFSITTYIWFVDQASEKQECVNLDLASKQSREDLSQENRGWRMVKAEWEQLKSSCKLHPAAEFAYYNGGAVDFGFLTMFFWRAQLSQLCRYT